MTYATNDDLPPLLRAQLPAHAQEIYRQAFNEAQAHYGSVEEARLRRIAWAAVKRTYEKVAGQWGRRDSWPIRQNLH